MKKYWIGVLLLFCFTIDVHSQSDIRLSLKIDPAFTYNRYTSETDTITFLSPKDDIRLTFGLAADIGFTDSYFFSTGLLYSLRSVNLNARHELTSVSEREQYLLEYIQVPVTLKLFTNDLGVDSKIYIQTGFTFDLLVNWKGKTKNDDLIRDFKFFDSSFYAGAGFDKQLGVSTAVFIGVYYQRGLVNILNDNPEATLKNDLLGLDLGLRF